MKHLFAIIIFLICFGSCTKEADNARTKIYIKYRGLDYKSGACTFYVKSTLENKYIVPSQYNPSENGKFLVDIQNYIGMDSLYVQKGDSLLIRYNTNGENRYWIDIMGEHNNRLKSLSDPQNGIKGQGGFSVIIPN